MAYTTWDGCSLHDRVCSSNSVAALDGWMDSWVFERATFRPRFRRMLNVASPHTSRDTLLCCIDVVRVQHTHAHCCETKRKMWRKRANVMKWGKNFIWHDIHVCIHVYRLYCHMNYICSWAHNGCSQHILYGWERERDGFFHTLSTI